MPLYTFIPYLAQSALFDLISQLHLTLYYEMHRPTAISKCRNPYYNMRSLLLLRIAAAVMVKCVSYQKLPQPLLQNASVIKNWGAEQLCRRSMSIFHKFTRAVSLLRCLDLFHVDWRKKVSVHPIWNRILGLVRLWKISVGAARREKLRHLLFK